MEKKLTDPNLSIYCSQLGMVIEFVYCMSMNEGLPCRNSIGCWNERIDIAAYMNTRFSDEELRKVFGGLPKSRIERIVDSIRSASTKE